MAKTHVQAIEDFAVDFTVLPTYQVPISFTILRTESSTIELTPSIITESLEILNTRFSGMNITFVQCGGVNYIDNNTLALNYPKTLLHQFSYNRSAVNVHISMSGVSFARNPLISSPDTNSFIHLSGTSTLTSEIFAHELGHYFALYHTFGPFNEYGSPYNNPINPNTSIPLPTSGIIPDHPYEGTNPRELVIREVDNSKNFPIPNCDIAGDLVCDTPAGGHSFSEGGGFTFPNLDDPYCQEYPFDDCSSGYTYQSCIYTGNYTDYNNDLMDPATTDEYIENLMSYAFGCRDKFTEGQFERMSYYLHEYENSRSSHLNASYLGNFSDVIRFQGSPQLIKDVRIKLTHPDEENFCIMTTGNDGLIQGNTYKQTTSAERWKLGTNGDFSYNRDDWTNGVTSFDIFKIRRYILGYEEFDGYQLLASDANNNNSVTTSDIIHLRQLILAITDDISAHESPWRFIPQYIIGNYEDSFNNNPFDMQIGGVQYIGAPYLDNNWVYTIVNGLNGQNGFSAIKVGDVNATTSFDLINNDDELSNDTPLFVEITELTSTLDGFKVKFDLNSSFEKAAFQAGLEFDKNYLIYKDLETQSDLGEFTKSDNFGLSKVSDGKVKFLWDSPTAHEEEIAVDELDFELDFMSDLTEEEFLDKLTISSMERSDSRNVVNGIISLDDNFNNLAFDGDGNKSKVVLRLSENFKRENSNTAKVLVYPTPANDYVVFDFNLIQSRGEGVLSIFDKLGRLVKEELITEDRKSFRLNNSNNLSTGAYFFTFKNETGVSSGKFIIQ